MYKQSYWHRPTSKPFSYYTICDILKARAEANPDYVIFIERSVEGHRRTMTNQELYKQSETFAKYLINAGVKRYDYIALFGPNSLEWLIGEFGILLAGAIPVHINSKRRDGSDGIRAKQKTGCSLFLVDPSNVEGIHVLMKDFNDKIILLRKLRDYPYPFISDLIDDFRIPNVELPRLCPDDVAFLIATTGSTGEYKLVTHTHFSVACKTPLLQTKESSEMKVYNDRPFAWTTGSPIYRILYGSQNVFLNTSVKPTLGKDPLNLFLKSSVENSDQIWDIIQEERCSDVYLSPYVLNDLTHKNITDVNDDFRVNMICTSGEVVGKTYVQLVGKYCNFLCVAYGASEISSISYKLIFQGETIKIGEVGNITEGNEIRVVDDKEQLVPVGTVGNIQIRSRSLFRGYFRDEERNKKVLTESGWFRIGDKAVMKEDGSLRILGRDVEVIGRGDKTIVLSLMEEQITGMEGLQSLIVIRVPNKHSDEVLCVCFVPEEGKDITVASVRQYCNDISTKNETEMFWETPTYYVRFSAFPVNYAGKIDKISIRNDAIQQLHL